MACLTTRRGYGWDHQRARRAWAERVLSGTVQCRRCGRFIAGWEPWDLGHQDVDRSLPAAPEHRRCNRATASHRVGRRAQTPASRVW
jgi:hypothetical protein